jgi:hypothetical protein
MRWITTLLALPRHEVQRPSHCPHQHGRCLKCQEPWCVVQGKDIRINRYSSMFPVCLACYEVLPIDQIERYIEMLGCQWMTEARSSKETEHIARDVELAKANMRADKAAQSK